MIGAVTGPLVGGVQAIGMAVSASERGATMRALTDRISHPRPNSKPSRRTLDRPQPSNFPIARLQPGMKRAGGQARTDAVGHFLCRLHHLAAITDLHR